MKIFLFLSKCVPRVHLWFNFWAALQSPCMMVQHVSIQLKSEIQTYQTHKVVLYCRAPCFQHSDAPWFTRIRAGFAEMSSDSVWAQVSSSSDAFLASGFVWLPSSCLRKFGANLLNEETRIFLHDFKQRSQSGRPETRLLSNDTHLITNQIQCRDAADENTYYGMSFLLSQETRLTHTERDVQINEVGKRIEVSDARMSHAWGG